MQKFSDLLSHNDRGKSICAVIGDPIVHSLSPLLHNSCHSALGLDKKFVFIAWHVTAEELPAAVKSIREEHLRGVSVTLPHKVQIMKLVDTLDPSVHRIGAVNTVVNENGILTGYNTDEIGVRTPLKKLFEAQAREIRGARVAIIGAGGAARAAISAALHLGAVVTVINRSQERLGELQREFAIATAPLTDHTPLESYEIIINATPLGMSPHIDSTPLPHASFHAGQIVFDLVYNPEETRLLREAKLQGATVLSGGEMFIEQAAAQYTLYTGVDAPREVLHTTITSALAAKKS